ncbi:DNA gyrase subunit A chloroplastic/mitochondrial [Prunus yedoensis var. nudiflora]|uniref:DNA gyrase subunit A chloroplastic/mitochondrial n=1 Tax=Prunus yedoensis var. nudiflora TaxID=2094558 RepID=A0A314YZ52_PRUYE|nr:DNA gyrase subunit A chloroplastic/mitochondrial [Prunus yedoensis var. nudiflora]
MLLESNVQIQKHRTILARKRPRNSKGNRKARFPPNPYHGRPPKRRTQALPTSENSEERIVRVELHKEATEAYMAYTTSVQLGRALPDVRYGLKPVHRRMQCMNWGLHLENRSRMARVVGEVLGKFHPHGDTAVYDSSVRMAQWCGDGGIMGHPWLEIKYQRAFEGWNNQLGEWKLNIIDNSLNGQAPSVAASFHDFSLRFPLIQGQGNFGSIDADPAAAMSYSECRLEVSMATNIPPHNLGELVVFLVC